MRHTLLAIITTAALLGGATVAAAAETTTTTAVVAEDAIPAACQPDADAASNVDQDEDADSMNHGQHMRACIEALHEQGEHGIGASVSQAAHDWNNDRREGRDDDDSVQPTPTATATATTSTATAAAQTTAGSTISAPSAA